MSIEFVESVLEKRGGAGAKPAERPMPAWGTTIWRGIRGRCPRCGLSPIFNGYLAVRDNCAVCEAPLGEMPADDAPVYIAMLVVVHIMGTIEVFIVGLHVAPRPWQYGVLLLLLALACMGALRVAKGGTIGVLLTLRLKDAEAG